MIQVGNDPASTVYVGNKKKACEYIGIRSLAYELPEETPEEEAALNFIQAVKDMKARFGIGDTIPEIQEEDIPKLSHYADKEANPLYPVPVLMDAQELEKFYYMLMPAKENTVQ